MIGCMAGLILAVGAVADDIAWCDFYRAGFAIRDVSDLAIATNLVNQHAGRVADRRPIDGKRERAILLCELASRSAAGSGGRGRLKAVSCSGPVGLGFAGLRRCARRGRHVLPHTRWSWPRPGSGRAFAAADGFHTYRVAIRETDIQSGRTTSSSSMAGASSSRPPLPCETKSASAVPVRPPWARPIWQWVRFQGHAEPAPAVQAPRVPGLEVGVGQTQVILPGAIYESLFKLADGTLVVGDRHSTDAGRTWQRGLAWHTGAYQSADGQILQLGFHSRPTDRAGYFSIPLMRSIDNGRTASSDKALLHIPDAVGGTGDDGRPYEGPLADHAIVGLRDGSLLAAMYGQFAGDRVPIPTMPEAWKCFKYRTFVVRSTDRGKTWDYLATVAYDPERRPGELLRRRLACAAGRRHPVLHADRRQRRKAYPVVSQPLARRRPHLEQGSADRRPRRMAQCLPDAQRGDCLCLWPPRELAGLQSRRRPHVDRPFLLLRRDHRPTTFPSQEVAADTLLVVYDRRQLDASGNLRQETVGTTVIVKR